MPGILLTRHFSLFEARCRCGCKVEYQHIPRLKAQAERLELLRADLNNDDLLIAERDMAGGEFRLIPLSWIRCPNHNEAEGGAENSRHLPHNCDAVDFSCPEILPEILYHKCKKYFNRVIWYRGRHFIHADMKPGDPQFWVKNPSPTFEPVAT